MDNEASPPEQNYTVVARRYRPRTFGELIGQDPIAQALGKAIATGRVGHAYLFTGARGVGKTSTARIFAKALNAGEEVEGEIAADISHAIDAGEDMDVIEIDGASNRGIEEIRQLRANVNVRPSRSRYKIYIIDEVHMLTNQAFNALLKTLEEPPNHVKFIFCTTDPDKLPITVLSRCQRFDFAPVKFEAIQLRLQEITQAEGFEADAEALALLARRAAGSMRDSQSLLEQVMSFSTERITVEQVHALLGTADESQLLALTEAMRDADALQVIGLVDAATQAGADPGQLAEQLLNYLRDVMAVGVGGGPELMKLANPLGHGEIKKLAEGWGVQTILSAIQILDEALVRMRSSVSATTLLEVALLQICQLEKLSSIPALLEAFIQGTPGNTVRSNPPTNPRPTVEKKNSELSGSGTSLPRAPVPAPHFVPQGDSAAGIASGSEIANERINASDMSVSVSVSETGVQESPDASPALVQPTAASATPSTPLVPSSSAIPLSRSQPATLQSATQPTNAMTHVPGSGSSGNASAPTVARESVSAGTGASPEALGEWRRALRSIDGMLADFAGLAVAVEPQGSDRWNVVFPAGATKPCEYCEVGQRKSELLAAVHATVGRQVNITFSVMPGELVKPTTVTPQAAVRAQKMRELAEHPFIKKICEVLDGEIVRVDMPR